MKLWNYTRSWKEVFENNTFEVTLDLLFCYDNVVKSWVASIGKGHNSFTKITGQVNQNKSYVSIM